MKTFDYDSFGNLNSFKCFVGSIFVEGKYKEDSYTKDELFEIVKGAERRFKGIFDWYCEKYQVSPEQVLPEQESFVEKSELEKDIEVTGLYVYKVKNAKNRNIEWALTFTQFKQILKRKRCFYTGVAFGEGRFEASFDRIDNKKGYTKENTVLCCKWVNELKNELFENPASGFLTDKKTLLKIISKMG